MDGKCRTVVTCHKQTDEDDIDRGKAKKRKSIYTKNKEHAGRATGRAQGTCLGRSQGEGCASREAETVGVNRKSVCNIKDGEEEESELKDELQVGTAAVKLSEPKLHQGTQLLSPGDVGRIQALTSTTLNYAKPNLGPGTSRAQLSTSSFVQSEHMPFGIPEVPLTDEPQVPLTETQIPDTEERNTESEGCTRAKRQKKHKNSENRECVDSARTPEEEEDVASHEADVYAEECLYSDFTDGEDEEDGDGIGDMSQLGAGAAKVKFQTVKQQSYKLVDKVAGTTSLAEHVMGCYRNIQEPVLQPQLHQGTQLHSGGDVDKRPTSQPQLHQGTQLHSGGDVDKRQTSQQQPHQGTQLHPTRDVDQRQKSRTQLHQDTPLHPDGEEDQRQMSSLEPCLETSPRARTQLLTSSMPPCTSNIQQSVVSEIQSLGVQEVPLTSDSLPGATQYNFIQVQQQFGEVTVKGAKNLSIGGTQNFGKPAQEEEEEKHLNTVQKIRKRTTSRILSWTQDMVETEGLQQVTDCIERGATWVTIKGRPGEGKSTVAYMALKDQHSKGRQVFQVVSPEEFNEVIMACPHPVIMLDDIFGDLEFDRAEWARWRPSLRPILDVKDVDKLTDDVAVVAGTSDGTSDSKQSKKRGPPKRGPVIILVGRDYVLKSSLTDLGRMADYITNIQHVVEISTQRDTEEKRKIWNINAQRKNIDFNETIVSKILQADCPHGFPHVCKMFVTEYEKEKNMISVESFFNRPLGFLNQTLNKFFADRNKCDLFKAIAQRDGQISEKDISGDDCKSAANDLVGSYLKKEDAVYMFDHPSIFDTVALILIQNYTSFVIEKCSLPFIHQRLRLKPSTRSVDDVSEDTDLVAHIPQCYAVQLAMRFAAEVQGRNLLHVLSHQACCDVVFIDKLMNFLKSGWPASVPDMLSLTDKSTLQSFCELLPSNKSHQFIDYIVMKENVQFSQNGIKEILLGVCRNAASNVLTYMKEDMYFDIDTRYGLDHQTPLMIAAGTRNSSFVKQILSLNPDLTAVDRRDKSVLHYVCENGLTSAVEYIVDKGVEVNVQMAFQQMPLYLAIQNGHIEIVNLLLNRGCESDNQKGLLCAIGSDKIDMVNLFLDRGAHVERNYLFIACERGKPDIVKMLLEKSESVNKKALDGKSFLHKAVGWGFKHVDTLLKAGADPNIRSNTGDAPLHTAAALGFVECADVLLSAGADVNIQNKEGDTPLHRAVKLQCKALVDVLVKAGADVNVKNNSGDTPIHLAIPCPSVVCVDVFQKEEDDETFQDDSGDTPVHTAANVPFLGVLLTNRADVNVQNVHSAVATESKECVNLLLKAEADVNVQNEAGDTPLHKAATGMSEESVHVLLGAGAVVNVQNKEGNTPLHSAVAAEKKDCVNMLLNAGADVNVQTIEGNTPLHLAVICLSKDCVNQLLENGAHVNIQNNKGDTPLHLATAHRSVECVTALMKAGAEVNVQNNAGDTPLHTAVKHWFVECVTALVKAGAEVNVQNNAGDTPLHLATAHRSVECVTALMKVGAEVNVQNNAGDTPLHLATAHRSVECVTALMKVGAEVNVQNNAGDTPLHTAVKHWFVECVTALVKAGAEVNLQNNAGDTPLHLATAHRSVECVTALMKTGAEVNVQNNAGDTPLHTAVKHWFVECVTALVKAGAEVNVQNNAGDTPLHTAVKHWFVECVTALVKAGAEVNLQNNAGDTPLHLATAHRSVECVTALMKAGAEVNVQNNAGDTPLHTAVKHWFVECVTALVKAGAEVNLQNNVGNTPLHFSVITEKNVTVLLKAGAEVNVQNATGDTPLHTAASSLSTLCVKELLKAGADINVQNTTGDTPLHRAASCRSKLCVNELLKAGADVNVQNGTGDTPFPSGSTCWPEEWDEEWVQSRDHSLLRKRRKHHS
ncbi:uncharacterized protein [Haliotis asinina]|uniref:uncharacterized protein n=1 Tax=Haliotis asinina TaxID=109174 RepID=UPI00353258FF